MTYTIEKNIPIPALRNSELRDGIIKLEIGDSVLVTDKSAANVRVNLERMKIKTGIICSLRKRPEGIRVWRIK